VAAASPNPGADPAAVSPSPGADVAAVTRSPCLVPGPNAATVPLSLWHIKLPLRCSDVSYHGAIGTRLNASNPLPLRRKDSL
jgi:hypothetical protein